MKSLKEFNWSRLCSDTRREASEGSCDVARTAFERDADQVAFSQSFRRLARKTQVHTFPEHDHIHNRLTHSLEVASIGRSIGTRIDKYLRDQQIIENEILKGAIPQIVYAAGLAHDIGNPAFGHAGEDAIRAWSTKRESELRGEFGSDIDGLQYFDGNAQSFRIASQRLPHIQSYCTLTYATLGALTKYPCISSKAKKPGKFCFLRSEVELAERVWKTLELNFESHERSPLSCIMETADDIVYRLMDIEDALELSLIKKSALVEPLRSLVSSGVSEMEIWDIRRAVLNPTLEAINTWLVHRDWSDNRFDSFFEGEPIDDRHDELQATFRELKKFYDSDIFVTRTKVENEASAYSIVETVGDALLEVVISKNKSGGGSRVKRIGQLFFPAGIPNASSGISLLIDYLSSLTDDNMTRLASVLRGM